MKDHAASNNPAAQPIEFSGSAESSESGWAFLGFIWRRLWLVLLAVIVGLGLGYLHFLQQPPEFQSSARMLIVRDRSNLPIPGLQPQTRYDEIHEELLRSPVIISNAIQNHDLGALPSMRSSGNPAGRIIRGLTVEAQSGNTGDLITFSYRSDNADECPRVLVAVIDAYREFLGETHQNVSQETVDLITQAKDVLDRQIMETQRLYQEFRDQAPLLYLGGEGRNVHETRLQQIESMRSALQVENFRTLAKIEAVEAALSRGGSREALNLMIGQMREERGQGEGGRLSIDDQLFPQLLEEQMLLDRFGPDHPKVTALRRRIDLTREHLLGKVPDEENGAREPRDFYQVYLDSLRELIKMNEEQIASLDRLFDHESDEARRIDRFQVQDANFRGEIARRERMFDAVVARLEEIGVSMDLGSIKTQIINPPGRGVQVAPDLNRSLTTAAILGLLAGLGLAFLVDSLDRRFRNPEDIQNSLGLPVIGHIPAIVQSSKKKKEQTLGQFDQTLRVFHQPRSRVSEAYRSVRTSVYFSIRGGGSKVMQVTSPHPGDGKTTLAANLAVAIADSGKSTLLIDADFRRPRMDKILGVPRSPGLSHVINGEIELADATHVLEINNLSVLSCGERVPNPAELCTSSRFEELLQMLREKYDYVVVDTPPVLAVTDPLAVAPRVDGVLMVIRLGKSARKASTKALEILDNVGATSMGIVVNGVDGGRQYGGYGYTSYSYGYGSYRYSYGYGKYGYDGYGDGYGYGYSYGDDDGKAAKRDVQPKTYLTEDNGSTRKR